MTRPTLDPQVNIPLGLQHVEVTRWGTLSLADSIAARMAEHMTRQANCTRRSVGAVVIQDDDVVGVGANGLSSSPGCGQGGCPRGAANSVDPYTPYDQPGPGYCPALHAEAAALLMAGHRSEGAVAYVTAEPCGSCLALLAGAGVARVVFPTGDYTPRVEVARRIRDSQ